MLWALGVGDFIQPGRELFKVWLTYDRHMMMGPVVFSIFQMRKQVRRG